MKEQTFNLIKKAILVLALVPAFTLMVQAQRIASVDVSRILESVNEYKAAGDELDKMAARWRQEIAQEYDKIKSLYNRFQAEQVLLSDEARRQREDEIVKKESEVREMQRKRFSPDGDLFQRRKELVQPIQDRVYAAIEAYAKERGYDFIFDKGGSAGMIFSNPQYDKTDDIINRLK
ncbi:OmpH family outer membrane protein [Haliscomenobacter sp.]|jgi:outer membrane protein|uniref:OmpH family outer membrane protein n=1 Tax=Haliscomenobacter sp. TaxID=2717303 RepID=UPI0035939272